MKEYIKKSLLLGGGVYYEHICEIKSGSHFKLFEDVKLLTFHYMYPNTIVYLYENGVLEFSDYEINKLKYCLETIEEYVFRLIDDRYEEINTYITEFVKTLKPYYKNIVSCFIHKLTTDIFEKNENIIYFDNNMIYYTGEINFPTKIEYTYHIENLDYFFIFDKNQFVYSKDKKIECDFWNKKAQYFTEDCVYLNINDSISEITSRLRNDKLKNILDEN